MPLPTLEHAILELPSKETHLSIKTLNLDSVLSYHSFLLQILLLLCHKPIMPPHLPLSLSPFWSLLLKLESVLTLLSRTLSHSPLFFLALGHYHCDCPRLKGGLLTLGFTLRVTSNPLQGLEPLLLLLLPQKGPPPLPSPL